LSSINDVSGLPIFEVFSDDKVVMGKFGTNALVVTGSQTGIGKIPANGTLDVSGSAIISGSLFLTGNETITGSLNVVTSITSSGQFTSILANNTANGGGQIYLNGVNGNRIDFNTNGVAAPSFTTRSAGTRMVFYPAIGASSTDYAIGIEGNTFWLSVPDTSGKTFKWYAGTTQMMSLTNTGTLNITAGATAASLTSSAANITSITGSSVSLSGDANITGLIRGGTYVSSNGSFPRMDLWGGDANLPDVGYASNTGIRFNISNNRFEHLVGGIIAMYMGPGGVTGSLLGTASFAVNAQSYSSSFSTSTTATSASFTTTVNALSASAGAGLTNLILSSGSFSNRLIALSSSFNSTQITASIISGSQITGSHFGTSSWAVTASYALASVSTLPANVVSASQQLTNGQGTAFTITSNVTHGQITSSFITGSQITGALSDNAGAIRAIPQNSQTANYTLVIGDAGKHISITTGSVTVPASVFNPGDVFSIFNNSTASLTIIQGSSVVMRTTGTSATGSVSVPMYGVATALCVAANTFTVVNTIDTSILLQNIQSAAYTLVLSDAGKHILHPSADTTARVFTIPANSSVPYPIGTVITFVNQSGAGVLTISITTDTMRLASSGTTGNRTLTQNGIATAIKLTATEWLISGTGLT
jgi:hypothetical protein